MANFPTRLLALACAGCLTLALSSSALAQSAQSVAPPPEPPDQEAAPPLDAQDEETPPRKPATFHFAGFVEAGYQGFVASQTFDATLGKHGGAIFGGGASLTHKRGYFVQLDITRFSAEGERAFAYGSQVFPLGIPLEVEVMPIEVSVGYKFFMSPPKPKGPPRELAPGDAEPADRDDSQEQEPSDAVSPETAEEPRIAPKPRFGGLKPYVAGGMGVVGYKESSSFAADGEDVDDSFTSFNVLAGIAIPFSKWLGAAVEFNYRWVKDALGSGGLSEHFGETDLGGPSFRVKVTVGR